MLSWSQTNAFFTDSAFTVAGDAATNWKAVLTATTNNNGGSPASINPVIQIVDAAGHVITSVQSALGGLPTPPFNFQVFSSSSGDLLTFDTAEHVVYFTRTGVDSPSYLTQLSSNPWKPLPAGSYTLRIYQADSQTTASVNFTYQDAWN